MKNLKVMMMTLMMCLVTMSSFSQSWEIKESKDEFGDATGDKYAVCQNGNGTFSNSATTNSDLTVVIFYSKDGIYLNFWEYDRSKANFGSDIEYGSIQIKDSIGTVHDIKVEQFKSTLYIKKTDIELFIKLMCENTGYLKCYYREVSKYSSSTYKFRLNTEGFKTIKETLIFN
jgi:hypothetical protein